MGGSYLPCTAYILNEIVNWHVYYLICSCYADYLARFNHSETFTAGNYVIAILVSSLIDSSSMIVGAFLEIMPGSGLNLAHKKRERSAVHKARNGKGLAYQTVSVLRACAVVP